MEIPTGQSSKADQTVRPNFSWAVARRKSGRPEIPPHKKSIDKEPYSQRQGNDAEVPGDRGVVLKPANERESYDPANRRRREQNSRAT